jgi:tetratricopeptide (TPR) repeat protein
MRRTVFVSLLAAALVAAVAASAPAQGIIGQKAPEIAAQQWINSPPLSNARLRGRIAVLCFWVTWSSSASEHLAQMTRLHKTYGPKGVIVIGLTDDPKARVESIIRQEGVTCPIACGERCSRTFGARFSPTVCIVDTAGNLAWKGYLSSAELDGAIRDQLAATPVQRLTEREKALALAMLEKVNAAIDKEQYTVAAALFAKVKGTDADTDVKAKAEEIRTTLHAMAVGRLALAEGHAEAKEYYEASVAFGDVAAMVPGTDLATEAKAGFKRLLANKEAAAVIAKHARRARSAELLAEIEKQRPKQPPAKTLAALDDLAKRYPETDAGKAAAEKARKMRADKTVTASMQGDAAERDCKGWLSMARNFLKAGMKDKARTYLQKVVTEYPKSTFANEAKEMLAKMEK